MTRCSTENSHGFTSAAAAPHASELVRAAFHARRTPVHSLFIDVNELTDKTENALKLVGDVYAARLFTLVASRLGLDQWKGNVREKLKTLDDIYRFTVEQTSMARSRWVSDSRTR